MRVDDLRRALEAVADDAPPGRSDTQLTMRRGRRLLATRRLAISAVALAVVGGVIGVGFGLRDHRSVIVEPAPATTPTTTTTTTPTTTSTTTTTTTSTTTTTTASSPYSDFVVTAMTRTVEVDFPSEHFMPSGDLISTPDGAGGTLQAIFGIRTLTADGKGGLVFFFHDHSFIGWDASQEAIAALGLEAAGPRSFKVTYANYAATDPLAGASLPPAVITYTWDGNRMTPETPPPPGIYGLNNPSANAIRVKLTG